MNIFHKTDSGALLSPNHHSHILTTLDGTNVRFAQTRRKTHLSSQSGGRAAGTHPLVQTRSRRESSRFYLLMYVKRLYVLFVVTPLTFCYSVHPSASIAASY
jgi:hypothetical protein